MIHSQEILCVAQTVVEKKKRVVEVQWPVQEGTISLDWLL